MSYYLLDNRNPSADGGFHGYSSRGGTSVRLVVIHTTESGFDLDGDDTGAENVARYLSRTDRQASYHDIVDSDSHVKCLPWDHTAFGARGHNKHAVHIAFAGDASKWGTLPDTQLDLRLRRCAAVVAAACDAHGVPVRRLYGNAARADGAVGICGHTDLDPDRRSDPGAGFPWARFLDLVAKFSHKSPQEDDMPYTPDQLTDIIQAAIFDAGFGRGDNVESFGLRVARIRTDARDNAARIAVLTQLVRDLAAKVGVETDEIDAALARIGASGGASAEAVADEIAERLAR